MNEDIVECILKAGKIAGEARSLGASMVDENVRLLDVAEEVEAYIIRKGAKPAFPANLSINNQAAHYTPHSQDPLKFHKGDLVKVDVGAQVNGYIGDTAETVEVGTKTHTALIEASAKALEMALNTVTDNIAVSAIGAVVERAIQSNGYVPVTNLTGHSMKQYNLHAGISVPNYDNGDKTKVSSGMLVAIEPFATDGAGEIDNGKPGNIYRILRDRSAKDKGADELLQKIKDNFNTLPFCERWCAAIDSNAQTNLKTLLRRGIIYSYSILNEVKDGLVSQKEHTVYLDGSKTIVTTR